MRWDCASPQNTEPIADRARLANLPIASCGFADFHSQFLPGDFTPFRSSRGQAFRVRRARRPALVLLPGVSRSVNLDDRRASSAVAAPRRPRSGRPSTARSGGRARRSYPSLTGSPKVSHSFRHIGVPLLENHGVRDPPAGAGPLGPADRNSFPQLPGGRRSALDRQSRANFNCVPRGPCRNFRRINPGRSGRVVPEVLIHDRLPRYRSSMEPRPASA